MSLTPQDHKAIAEETVKALRGDRKDCGDRAGSCLIYTDDPDKVKLHLDQHTFVSWLMGWVNPARKETKSFLIKGFVLALFAFIAAIAYLFTPLSVKGIFK